MQVLFTYLHKVIQINITDINEMIMLWLVSVTRTRYALDKINEV
jgi:hypothetical protein